jgi:hypothetical protein
MRQAAGIDLDPSLSVAARQLQEQDLHRRLQFDISAGYEYDSNVGLFQEGIATPRDIPHRDDGRFVIEPRARFSIIQNDKVDAGVSTTNYFSYQSTLSDFDVSSYQVGAFFNYQLTTNLLAGVRYDFNYVDLGHEPYLTRNFVTPEVTYFENNFGYTGAFYQYDAQQYTDIAGTGRLDRDGKIGGVGLLQSINLPEFFSGAGRAELQLIGRFRHQNTKGQDYDGDLYDTGAMLYLPLPMKLKADIGVNFDVEDYSNANSLDAENRQRHDSEFTFSAGLMRQLNRWTAIRAEYTYVNHDSNVRTAGDPATGLEAEKPYEFSHHVVGVKMIMSY